jgi:hypothetical protein
VRRYEHTQIGYLILLGAVAITLLNGRKFALGTDDTQGLVDAIRRFAATN